MIDHHKLGSLNHTTLSSYGSGGQKSNLGLLGPKSQVGLLEAAGENPFPPSHLLREPALPSPFARPVIRPGALHGNLRSPTVKDPVKMWAPRIIQAPFQVKVGWSAMLILPASYCPFLGDLAWTRDASRGCGGHYSVYCTPLSCSLVSLLNPVG